MLTLVENSLIAALTMFWNILWALILGFALSGIIMAFVPKKRMTTLLGKAGPKELGLATLFGAVSSSCSYAAASMTKTLFQKGAHIISALAFLLASTNLVLELSLVLWLFLGWQFVLAEFLGGVVLVVIMAVLMRLFAPLDAFRKKQEELSHGAHGETHSGHGGHHSMADPDRVADPRTLEGWREAARNFVSEWKMIWKDVALGVVISGFLMTAVPDRVWQSLFLQNGQGTSGALKLVENAFVGPLVSVVSFVCSVGNIPLAAVLYRGGIGFGGAISFIFADLIIIPLLLVYRKYFGWKLALWIFGIFYVSMALAGITIDLLFQALRLVPSPPNLAHAGPGGTHGSQAWTLWLNLVFGLLGIAFAKLATKKSDREHRCH